MLLLRLLFRSFPIRLLRIRFGNAEPGLFLEIFVSLGRVALETVPWLDKQLRMLYLASAVKAGETQFSREHSLVNEAAGILDVDPVPEVIIKQTPILNAKDMGVNRPFIVQKA